MIDSACDLASKMTAALLLLALPAIVEGLQTTRFTSARDYLAITSENYPLSYPGPETWRWQWSVPSGVWAVIFLEFDLACGTHDSLVIADSKRNLTFTCENKPLSRYKYFINSPSFTVQFQARDQHDVDVRGFKCQVLYGPNREELQTRIDAWETVENPTATEKDDSPVRSNDVIIILIIVIVLVVFGVVMIVLLLLLRRRHHQQTTNTSVHLNIESIRRESSVSYTRNGNGHQGGPRPRLDSESSLAPETTGRTRRPPKRSESNASWAMRAEMATSVRNGSCSSEGHHGNLNLYSPFPGGAETAGVGGGGKGTPTHDAKANPALMGCRLSTIAEEPCAVAKLTATFPMSLPVPPAPEADGPSLAIENAGYMLMTRCQPQDYINCGMS